MKAKKSDVQVLNIFKCDESDIKEVFILSM